jgi:Mlc titration factor MtfA (ptsG expression regulator)
MTLFLLLLLLAASILVARYLARQRSRKQLLATALSEQQRATVVRQVPLVKRLPPGLRENLEGRISLFLHQVKFIGCNGLEVSEKMRLSIAAQACLLVVNSDAWYDNLTTILVYPDAFRSMQREHDGYVVTERETVRTGESWSRGPVVLSWAHAEQGAANDRDGHNVVLHEFAHQFDDLSGHTDGAPVLNTGQSFAEWERVFVTAYERHAQNVETGTLTVLDEYGASNVQEFFAVAIESFFERPGDLKREEPDVYQQLSKLLRLDPLTWV